MDNNSKQTQPTLVPPQAPSSNSAPAISPTQLDDGYNVTMQMDPTKIDASQVQSDLDALKEAEGTSGRGKVAVKKVEVSKPQELVALELSNPFRGE